LFFVGLKFGLEEDDSGNGDDDSLERKVNFEGKVEKTGIITHFQIAGHLHFHSKL